MEERPGVTVINVPGVELHEVLGQGAFGAVYRGHHQTLDVEVAVKLIDAAASEQSTLERALAEARLMARLDHPNLLRIYDAGRLGSSIYLVLEIMDDSCVKLKRLSADHALDIARQLLSGLQALHDARILHRDIKPANCLIRHSDNRVKLADLGIAVTQATRTESVYEFAGTLPFMAPELFESPPRYSPKSDLYALGLTLACMLLDQDPFPSGSMAELIAWVHGNVRPRLTVMRPDLPPALTTLVERLIACGEADRPPRAAIALSSLYSITPQTAAVADSRTDQTVTTIGPWVIGSQVYASSNWRGFVVTHVKTGMAARLSQLQPGSPILHSSQLILASADRASRLDHPGIMDVIDWGVEDEFAYVVTAPQGRTLEHLVGLGGAVDEMEAVKIGVSLADALAYLHGCGFVYQVLDPGSAMIAPDARSIQLGWPMFCVPAGSPIRGADGKPQRAFVERFAAPEAAFYQSDTIEPAVDIYGLGALMYYLLAGNAGAVGVAVSQAIADRCPPDVRVHAPTVTAPTAKLVGQMMHPDPAFRPASAAEVRDRLARIVRRLRGAGRQAMASATAVMPTE